MPGPDNLTKDIRQPVEALLPAYILSPLSPLQVTLISNPAEATRPSKDLAELLADGQCEV